MADPREVLLNKIENLRSTGHTQLTVDLDFLEQALNQVEVAVTESSYGPVDLDGGYFTRT